MHLCSSRRQQFRHHALQTGRAEEEEEGLESVGCEARRTSAGRLANHHRKLQHFIKSYDKNNNSILHVP